MTILVGDCRELMRRFPDNFFHAIVTDPPYGLEFMGKDWDSPQKMAGQLAVGEEKRGMYAYGGSHSQGYYAVDPNAFQAWTYTWAVEALRVLKPGGHLIAFGGTRMYHRMASAIEDAGFEIRDMVNWLYGQGFPKSMDVSKAIDKAARGVPQGGADPTSPNHGKYKTQATEGKRGEGDKGQGFGAGPGQFMAEQGGKAERDLVSEAEQWSGWGTALKPAQEPIVLARKPFRGTVANNVLEHGTGALNIDGTRISADGGRPLILPDYKEMESAVYEGRQDGSLMPGSKHGGVTTEGRWPANVILSHDPQCVLIGVKTVGSGETKVTEFSQPNIRGNAYNDTERKQKATGVQYGAEEVEAWECVTDCPMFLLGEPSRFFYNAKASKKERNAGLDSLPDQEKYQDFGLKERMEDGAITNPRTNDAAKATKNNHPTVKPIALMRYLIRLVTPPQGRILDPFAGSGTTGIAAHLEDVAFVGMELSEEYAEIAKARIKHWKAKGDSE